MSGARLEDVVVNTINTRSAGKMHFLNSGRPSCLCWCGPNERPPHPNLLQFHPQIRPKSHILIMDNLSSHKSSRVLEKIHAVGVDVLFLPPYSPDLNPIEQIFAKIKASLCRFAARTERQLYRAISKAIRTVTTSDCLNCFRNSGYVAQ